MRSIQDRKAASAVQKLRSNARREPLSESFTHAIRVLDIPLVERWALVLAPAKSRIKAAGRAKLLAQPKDESSMTSVIVISSEPKKNPRTHRVRGFPLF
jgi:hypothetical protein